MRNRRTQAGLTLIELLVVIAIVSLLGTVLVIGVPRMLRSGERKAVEVWLLDLATQVDSYSRKLANGDYPPTTLEGYPGAGPMTNRENMGIESLLVCLTRKGTNGAELDLGGDSIVTLENYDGDRAQEELSYAVEGSKELWELVDKWGTPFVYFHHRDYARAESQGLGLVSHAVEGTTAAVPARDPETNRFYNPRSFQIISAGPDQTFGTPDDIGNFNR